MGSSVNRHEEGRRCCLCLLEHTDTGKQMSRFIDIFNTSTQNTLYPVMVFIHSTSVLGCIY